jgi:CHAT domain-containing protein
MQRMLLFLGTLVCLPPAYASAAPPAREMAAAFVAALAADDLTALTPLSEAGRAQVRRWTSVSELVDLYECFSVASYDVTEDATTLHLRLRGTARTAGRPRREVALPESWVLDVVVTPNGWRIRNASTAERHAARAILAGSGPLDETSFGNLDPLLVLRELVDEAADMKTPRARDLVEQAIDRARGWNAPALESRALRRLSTIETAVGRMDQTRAAAQESLAVARRTADPDLIAGAHFAVAVARWLSRDVPAALEHFHATAADLPRLEDPRHAMKGLYMVGYVERQRGNVREAAAAQEQIAAWAEEFRWQDGRANAAAALGVIYGDMGDFETARRHYQRAQDLARQSGDGQGTAIARSNLAAIELILSNVPRALVLAREAADLAAKHVPVILPQVYSTIASMLVVLGRPEEAEEAICRGREAAGPAMDDWTAADFSVGLSEVRELQRRYGEALLLADEARAQLQRAQAAPRALGQHIHGRIEIAAARALRALGRRDEAIDELTTAVAAIEEQRAALPGDGMSAIGFLRNKVAAYRELAATLAESGRAEEALAVAEQMKARALRDTLEREVASREVVLSAERRAREARLNERLVALSQRSRAATSEPERRRIRKEVEQVRFELHDLVAGGRLLEPGERSRMTNDSGAILSRLADELPERALVVEYVLLDDRLILFQLTRTGRDVQVTLHEKRTGANEIAAKVERLTAATESRDYGYAQVARELYELLIEPLEPALRGRELLCIVPDGVLWNVPFSVLGPRPREALVERVAVFYAPSLRTLHARDAVTPPRGPLLALANPTLGPAAAPAAPARLRDLPLAPLPDAEYEVRAIAALYPSSAVYVGAEATERVVKESAARHRVIHLATHGVLDGGSPLYSSIVLAGSEREDGFLEAREIAAMRLDADVAVVSACELARGGVAPGEGLIGMSWALMAAGCPTSVVSQWKVASRSTAELMVAFHRELVGGRSTAEALRRAQLRLRGQAQYRHPFYWAPFVVVGQSW